MKTGRRQKALQEEWRAQLTLDALGAAVVRADAAGAIEYLNPMAERLSGWPSAEAVGRLASEVLPITDGYSGGEPFDAVACALGLGRAVNLPKESLLARCGGKQFAVQGSASPILDRHGHPTGVVLTLRDVSETRGLERDLLFLSTHDPLTGLLNRRELDARLQRALFGAAAGDPWALCWLDLDNFGVINDAHGHVAGDEVLKQVAAVLRTRIRQGDVVARVGSDEFAVLLDGCAPEDLAGAAEKLRVELEGIVIAWREGPFQVRASIGAVAIGETADPLYAAQAACRVAGERGGNCVHVYAPEDTAVVRRAGQVAWLHRLNDALENHRFELLRQRIQPVRADRDGRAAPAIYEVLLRLPAEGGGAAQPMAFLPTAERYHLSQAIDRWVVQRVLATVAAQEESSDILTVNLSAHSLASLEFLGFLKEEVRTASLAADRLCFEVTERGIIADLRQAVRFIEEIKSLGCRFLLDDFGRGMSAFAYLGELPVDFLKIDGKIVSGAGGDPVRRAMLESIQHLGRVMRLQTVGECVEDEETLRLLGDIGVDFAQGNLLHRPEPFAAASGPLPS